MATKRKTTSDLLSDNVLQNGIDLFVNEPADEEEVDSDSTDSSESEESEYSGLEEEDESSDDEMSEDDSDDAVVDDDDEDDDDDSSNNDTSTITITSIKKKGNVQKNEKLDNVPKFKIKDNANTVKSDMRDNAKQPKKPKGKKVSSNQKENINAVAEKESDEYDHDSSDEEDIRNTVGNIPLEWYKNLPHIGYDVEGRKLIKPEQADNLDDFLNKVDDPNYWRTVTNKMTGQNVVLSKDDVDLIQNLQGRKHPTAASEDQFAPWVDIFSNEVMIHPLSNRPEHKRSFIPSKWEKLKVGQMVHALKMGWMKPSKTEKEKEEEEDDTDKYYMLWKDEDETSADFTCMSVLDEFETRHAESEINKRFRQHIPAPKMVLPGHEESYNPPPEYLFTKEEEEKWEETEPEDRRIKFIPQKYSSLRSVPAFKTFINERFERCLDLYLCPRQRKMRMNVNLEDLLPKLPKPKDLQPFPTTQSLVYKGHTDLVRCISADPSGQWLVSGSDDHTVRVWEVSTGRCMKTFNVEDTIKSISWNPNPAVSLIACAVDKQVLILNPGVGDKLQVSNTDNMLNAYEQQDDSTDSKLSVTWSVHEGQEYEDGFRLKILHGFEVTQVVWHGKGDYFAVVMPKGVTKSVFIHQLSRRRSQNPFSKSKGIVQCIQFHPLRPFLFVATQRFVRVYNLLKQELSKKLMTNCKWVSSMAVHPEGDNVIIGSYDSRLGWFDMDLSTKPYQTLRHHKKAIRQVCYHRRYPLFASASDDCSIIVCHGMVYNDLLQNPLIVPVKVLRGHTQEKGVGILDCIFHPTQPWIFSAGADGTIRLYT